jgi:peptidoglycan-N-acetylglucosamine deacetylase
MAKASSTSTCSRRGWAMRRSLPLAAVVLALAGAFPAAAAGGSHAAPLQIATASLAQDGQELVWRVELAAPFAPGALARDHLSLCLLIGFARGATHEGQLCIAGPTHRSRVPQLLFARVSSGSPAEAISATVTRASARELTATFLPAAIGLSYRPVRWQVVSASAAAACTPPAGSSEQCETLFPSPPATLALHEPQLVGCVPNGPSWVFHGRAHLREVALTFDDGPWSDTPQFLSLLEREHVVATFFQIGDQIAEYGEHGVDRRMLADGDMIGDHTWNYGGDVVAGGAGAAAQITEAAAAIRRATGGFEPCLFRAPGGNVTPALLQRAHSLGFATIQWDVDPRDWATPGTAAIYDNVIANAHDGAIVIQHDGGGNRSETLAALPMEIAALRRRGYRFVTLTQMLGYGLVYR